MILQHTNIQQPYSRIVSLVPSQTELLYDLGLEEEVVGITKFCVHPNEWFRSKTRIGGTKTVHIEEVRKLSPDLIIANKEENLKEQVEELAKSYDVLITDVNNLDSALNMIQDVGNITGRAEEATKLISGIKSGFEELEKKVRFRPPIKTAYFIWKDPYMVAGGDTFINDMLLRADFQNIFRNKSRYPQIDLNEISEGDCELILLSSEPYPFKKIHIEELKKIFPDTRIALVDGEMFSWYGSRLLLSAGYLANDFG